MNKPKMADADSGLFKPGSKLKHRKTGGFYKVLLLANVEASLEPAYVYESMQSHDFWIRPQAEMEDGRFELIPAAEKE
ncbi:hypothetical protein TUM22923_04950 [Polynucleobacter sp. TUM22923]|jgi:hypothetical protein|uniref:hypothetical protein n=1 Tax=Polynucleobacter sp. TUM22923 TaxID=3022126 RepID=UPI002573B9A1|nr:hypothetical protein [Polynucleobacter sp. TUM22923]BDX21174.1 hypothetical protein TUM22923_04950 [Polynucleobacter sp. TUM22923]